jgi:hypothetical protein
VAGRSEAVAPKLVVCAQGFEQGRVTVIHGSQSATGSGRDPLFADDSGERLDGAGRGRF